MIKNFFIVLFATLLLTTASFADGTADNEFEKIENNITVSFGDLSIGHRGYVDDEEKQLFLGYDISDSFNLQYRNASGIGEDEHRFRATHNTFQVGNFYANAVAEWRMKTDDGDDILRVRPEAGVSLPISNKLSAGYVFSPHYNVDNQDDGWTWDVDHYRHIAHVDYQLNDQFSFGLFAQMDRDDENELQQKFIGTELRFNFPSLSIFHEYSE